MRSEWRFARARTYQKELPSEVHVGSAREKRRNPRRLGSRFAISTSHLSAATRIFAPLPISVQASPRAAGEGDARLRLRQTGNVADPATL